MYICMYSARERESEHMYVYTHATGKHAESYTSKKVF